MNKLYLISCGTGDKEDITLRALNTIKQCEHLIGAERLITLFAGDIPSDIVSDPLKAANLINSSSAKNLGVLLSGDAGFYSMATSLREQIKNREIVTIAGVGIVQATAARLNIPWLSMKYISLHADNSNSVNVDGKSDYLVLTRTGQNVANILDEEILGGYAIQLIVRIGHPNEKIIDWSGGDFICESMTTIILLKK